jgi:hypothetical protein
MKRVLFCGRRAAQIETEDLRLTVTQEGGHVAELLHKESGISPLWIPKWRSVEPSEYSSALSPEYGDGPESRLVAGLLGHNICLDLFGGPDPEEAAAGIPVHGEAPVSPYEIEGTENELTLSATLPNAQMTFRRELQLLGNGVISFSESVDNLSSPDRPIGWTQHVTLGKPFLERGSTRFVASATRSKVYEHDFNDGLGMQTSGAEFDWPLCPRKDGSVDDLSVFTSDDSSGGFTAHLMDPSQEHAFFLAWSPVYQLAIGYIWRREDFPWLSRWEENHLRSWAPWNSRGFALGMEFGVSPMVESRRKMVERGNMFNTPTFRWIPAQSCCSVRYYAIIRHKDVMPSCVHWDREDTEDTIDFR